MNTVILQEIYTNLVNALIALAVVLIAYAFAYITYIRKIENKRQKRQYMLKGFYLACFIYLFLLARIWVEGFTHLIAVLGLVSAALVVSTKETIMNIVASLVINWRNLFTEDDLVQVQQYKGYVKSLGLLYFTLAEVSEKTPGLITGRVVRIPNSQVTTHPVVNFSQTSNLLEQTLSITITRESNLEAAKTLLKDITTRVLSEKYSNKQKYSSDYIKKQHKYSVDKINLDPTVMIQPKLDKPAGTELTVKYYAFHPDSTLILQSIWSELLKAIDTDNAIQLAYVS